MCLFYAYNYNHTIENCLPGSIFSRASFYRGDLSYVARANKRFIISALLKRNLTIAPQNSERGLNSCD